jgi:hypothetical protein
MQEGSLAGLEPIGMAAYVNNNVLGLLQRVTAMFTMRKWSDRCLELSWSVPWLEGSARRVAQTASAAITRHNQDSIFGPALDEVSAGAAAAGGHTSVIVERSHVSFDRSASLSDTVYGTVGAWQLSAWLAPRSGPMHAQHACSRRGAVCMQARR